MTDENNAQPEFGNPVDQRYINPMQSQPGDDFQTYSVDIKKDITARSEGKSVEFFSQLFLERFGVDNLKRIFELRRERADLFGFDFSVHVRLAEWMHPHRANTFEERKAAFIAMGVPPFGVWTLYLASPMLFADTLRTAVRDYGTMLTLKQQRFEIEKSIETLKIKARLIKAKDPEKAHKDDEFIKALREIDTFQKHLKDIDKRIKRASLSVDHIKEFMQMGRGYATQNAVDPEHAPVIEYFNLMTRKELIEGHAFSEYMGFYLYLRFENPDLDYLLGLVGTHHLDPLTSFGKLPESMIREARATEAYRKYTGEKPLGESL